MSKQENEFLKALYQYNTYTENGAVSHSTTGNALLDYFSKSATYMERTEELVFADMSRIWEESPKVALQLVFYNRIVTRKILGKAATENVQKGQGNRSEFRKCLQWLSRFHPEIAAKNLWLVPLTGTWKDLWHEELIDSIDKKVVYALIKEGLENEYDRALLAKYLPKIRSKANTFNERHIKRNKFAFGLIKYLGWSPTEYRKFKSSGRAHEFQKQMCRDQWKKIDFKTIPGKALFQLVNHYGEDEKTSFQRHGIEETYLHWIKQQPVAKFTGYVYELMTAAKPRMSLAQKYTLDKQFEGLLELARKDKGGIRGNVWCALDTSGSMTARVGNTTAFNICISLGVYFATLNEGNFKDHVIMFDNVSRVKKLSGGFSEKVIQILSETTAWGSTNFQSVIDEIVRVRVQNPNVPVKEFPDTLIVVSDMQFNPAGDNTQTNYEEAMKKLDKVGLPRMRIVWWWVTGRGQDFPSQINDEGVIMIGGFDGSILSLLLGGEQQETSKTGEKTTPAQINPYSAMLKALDQEILMKVSIS